ncbi:hypothetical protein [uncultured Metabacillus sp.]|uniref:hypothetical protein n=1 Tax=uncultured Metabacillus sp. TaxID=2860135 RepID=UPI00260E0378|nr:hypothetical protein [uncultured Metabacillus sp.]
MFNQSSKKFYLTKVMKGFENILKTRITSIEQYQDNNLLHIYLYVNPTNDIYTDVQRIETTVTYNLTNDKYTIKCEGKGARKYNKQVKSDVKTIINGLVKEAHNYYKGDTSESLFMTQQYYHSLLKQQTEDTAILNEFYYQSGHVLETIQEIDNLFNDIMNKLNVNNLEVASTKEDNTANEETFTVGNRCFSSYSEAKTYCDSVDFDYDMIIKEVATLQPSTTQEATQQTEVFHLYKNTFTTYSEAYNYALTNMIPVTMIISSLHPTMTNERLKQLEHEYVFSKGNMSYNDMIEYFNYIESLPITIDRDDRYYKLKSYIQRYEYNQQQKLNREKEQQNLSLEGSRLLVFMKEKGLQLEIREGWQRYLYKGEHVYSFHGCSVEKYYNDMLTLFNTYFSEYANEYSNSKVYYYKGNENTIIDNDNYPKGWISYNNTTKIAVFNRQLTNEEMTQYNLIYEDNIQILA